LSQTNGGCADRPHPPLAFLLGHLQSFSFSENVYDIMMDLGLVTSIAALNHQYPPPTSCHRLRNGMHVFPYFREVISFYLFFDPRKHSRDLLPPQLLSSLLFLARAEFGWHKIGSPPLAPRFQHLKRSLSLCFDKMNFKETLQCYGFVNPPIHQVLKTQFRAFLQFLLTDHDLLFPKCTSFLEPLHFSHMGFYS